MKRPPFEAEDRNHELERLVQVEGMALIAAAELLDGEGKHSKPSDSSPARPTKKIPRLGITMAPDPRVLR